MAEAVRVSHKVESGVLVISVVGVVDTYSYQEFNRVVYDILKSAGTFKVILECSGVSYMASTGIGAFVNLFKEVTSKQGSLVVAGISQAVHDVFKLLGFSSFLTFVDDVDLAMAAIGNRLSFYPVTFQCPICNKKLRVPKSGTYKCTECKTTLSADQSGKVHLK